MKIRIIDAEALKAVSPPALTAYARGEGWRKSEAYGGHADIYIGKDLPEIVLPRTDLLADYASVVSRLIGIFGDLREGRTRGLSRSRWSGPRCHQGPGSWSRKRWLSSSGRRRRTSIASPGNASSCGVRHNVAAEGGLPGRCESGCC